MKFECVSASLPTCSVNTSSPGDAVHESDVVEISCIVEFIGDWLPVVNCSPEVLQVQLETPVELVNEASLIYRASYVGVVAAADLGDWAVITCETTFSQSGWGHYAAAPQNVQIVPDAPRYRHTWYTSIRVFNTTGNIGRAPVSHQCNTSSRRGCEVKYCVCLLAILRERG